MTANRRIFLNIVATYGRSLYAMILGLFTARWVLQALGHVDYGLYGVVGGLIGFVAFFNGLMAGAVGRFYAFAVGEAQKDGYEAAGLENCRRWFNVALLIHTVLPTVLIVAGYPIGVWAVEHYLTIPPDRVEACVWVWRYSCIACYVGMVGVPFSAMYTAKQEIAELTIYSFAGTTLNAAFLYYMVTHPGFWLVKYAAWTCVIGVTPQLLVCALAFRFKECRFRAKYLWDVGRMKELSVYAGGRFVCALAQMFRNQGVTIAVNKVLGPARNAAVSVGNSVINHASSLTASCMGALYPAITNAAGRGDYGQMRALAYRMCKLATVAMMAFAVPLILEIDNIMVLWLRNPPDGAARLCVLILAAHTVDHLTDGHWMSIFACGKVTLFNACESIGFFLGFGVGVALLILGFGLDAVGCCFLVGNTYALVVKLVLGRKLCGLSAHYWLRRALVPIAAVGAAALGIGVVPRLCLEANLLRVIVTTLVAESVLLGLTWLLVFEREEKEFVMRQLRTKFGKFFGQGKV